MTKRNIRFFSVAEDEAQKSDFHPQIGCVLVYGNRILAKAHNGEKTHPEQWRFNIYRDFGGQTNVTPKIHAEIAALAKTRHLNVDWGRVEIYTWRITKDGRKNGIAKPCAACTRAIRDRGIRHIFYTGDNCLIYECYGGGLQ